MSELTVDLLVAGAVVIVLVMVYNKWQESRLAKRGNAAFGSRHDDVLLAAAAKRAAPPAAERVEPVGSIDAGASVAPAGATPTLHVEPAAATPAAPVEPVMPAAAPGPVPDGLPLDGRIDAVALLLPAEGVAGIDVTPLLAADWSPITKTLSRYGERDGHWEPLAAGQHYARVALGLQLVDRKGPVAGMELAAFGNLLEEFAAAHGWQLEFASSENNLGRAASLDRLCAEVDFKIAFDLLAPAERPFAGNRIRGLAEANGMRLTNDGGFQRSDDTGLEWFVLRNRGATPFSPEHMREFSTRALSLSLDVPRVPREAFGALRLTLTNFSEAMQASIADEQGRVLDAPALDRVGAQIAAIHDRLEANGIDPGGALALRLFA
jgi:FtsZ-interacting cell division protein ZipA